MIPLHQRHLGRLPSHKDPRTLQLAKYLPPLPPPAPPKRLWQLPVSVGQFAKLPAQHENTSALLAVD